MYHRIEEIAGVLNRRPVRFEFDGDRSAVDVVWIGAPVGRAFGEHRIVAFSLVLFDDRLETCPLFSELLLEPLECRSG